MYFQFEGQYACSPHSILPFLIKTLSNGNIGLYSRIFTNQITSEKHGLSRKVSHLAIEAFPPLVLLSGGEVGGGNDQTDISLLIDLFTSQLFHSLGRFSVDC